MRDHGSEPKGSGILSAKIFKIFSGLILDKDSSQCKKQHPSSKAFRATNTCRDEELGYEVEKSTRAKAELAIKDLLIARWPSYSHLFRRPGC